MEPFATVDDLLNGWPGKQMSAEERSAAGVLIERASAQLHSMLARKGIAVDPTDEVQAINLRTVTLNMVRRSMASSGPDGLSSVSQTIGSTTASVQWANPEGAFFLSRVDKEVLGLLGGGRVGWAPLAARAEGDGQ